MTPSSPQSSNESLLHDLLGLSIGAPSLFIPSESIRNGSQREVSDLAWTARGLVCLIWTTRCGWDLRNPTPSRLAKKAAEGVAHNIRQARGGLRRWRTLGEPIQGRNEHQTFSVAAQGMQTIILSVVDSPMAYSWYLTKERDDLDVDHCCTIPASVLRLMTHFRFGIVDVVRFMGLLYSHGLSLSETESLDMVASYARVGFKNSKASELKYDRDAMDKILDEFQYIRNLGTSPTPGDSPFPDVVSHEAHREGTVHFSTLFNEMSLCDTMTVAWAFHTARQKLANGLGDWAYAQCACENHDIGVAFAKNMFPSKGLMSHLEKFITDQARRTLRPGPLIMVDPISMHISLTGPGTNLAACAARESKALRAAPQHVVGLLVQ